MNACGHDGPGRIGAGERIVAEHFELVLKRRFSKGSVATLIPPVNLHQERHTRPTVPGHPAPSGKLRRRRRAHAVLVALSFDCHSEVVVAARRSGSTSNRNA